MTRINAEIRKIIRALPAVSYVGYTATPFANVFIDPYPLNQNDLDDLYPEDFITALPRSDGYFGSREVFGYAPTDPDGPESPDEAGRNMIRHVPAEKLKLLQPSRIADKDSFYPEMTDELQNAVIWFLLSCAIRRARGQHAEHMTMLVHTSPYIIQHRRMAELLEQWTTEHFERYFEEPTQNSEIFQERMAAVLEYETSQVPLEYNHTYTIADLKPYLQETLYALEYAVENGESFERLNYTQEPKTYIVVGGTVLARGLTLEGLSVSFFLRTSMQYDTLLQMGRWFGYRKEYEDLPRLWTTAELAANFRALASIEEEIRDDINNYKAHGVTPQEFAVRVRAIPGMAITAASKMRHAYRSSISFEGRHVQTIRFDHLSHAKVNGNWDAATKFVDAVGVESSFQLQSNGKRYLAQNVKLQEVRKFLTTYDICEHHMDLKKVLLLGYIDQVSDTLQQWNVGIITPDSKNVATKPLGHLGHVNSARRSQLKDNERGYADIKALMSKNDILIDATDPDAGKGENSWAEIKSLSLLPRLKAHGVVTILERLKNETPSVKGSLDLLREFAALKTTAPSGGTRADGVAVSITAELRRIAQKLGFPDSSTQAARAQFDQDAAMYLAQNEELQTGEALRDDVWAFMTTVLAPDVVTWRFGEKDGDRVARFAGGVRNTFQRLWVRGTILDRGSAHEKRWELIVNLTEDAMVQIFERASIGGNPPFARAIAEGWLRTSSKIGRSPMESVMRSATKILRVRNQILDLGYLQAAEIEELVSETFDTAASVYSVTPSLKERQLEIQ